MNTNKEIIKNYYNDIYQEDDRFTLDKAHMVEPIITKKYIEKYLKKGDRILEIGAATGAYSLYYAEKGYKVDAVDLSSKNIEILKSKIKDNMDIKAQVGDALDLNMYDDNTFDVTLLFGPLYHLFTEEEKNKAIEEALRVTKKDGYLLIAYCTNESVILNYGLRKGSLKRVSEISNDTFEIPDIPEEIFSTFYVDEFDKMMSKYNIKHITNFGQEGLSTVMRDYVNELSEEEFNIWIDYNLKTCERKDMIGTSTHVVYVGKKN